MLSMREKAVSMTPVTSFISNSGHKSLHYNDRGRTWYFRFFGFGSFFSSAFLFLHPKTCLFRFRVCCGLMLFQFLLRHSVFGFRPKCKQFFGFGIRCDFWFPLFRLVSRQQFCASTACACYKDSAAAREFSSSLLTQRRFRLTTKNVTNCAG